MFKKLLSNLPFNPSLIGQLSFYAQRLRQEEKLRRTGFILLAMAVLVQMFAVMSPPQPTLANSNNDMIDGGIRSQAEAVNYCNQNIDDYRDELAYFGITCADIAKGFTTTIKSTDQNRQLMSMGELYYNKAGATPVTIEGRTYWLRYLWAWDSGAYSTYTAVRGITKYGQTFFILFDCGNLVFIGQPKTPPPPPKPPEKCPYNQNLLKSDERCKAPCTPSSTEPRCKPCEKATSSQDYTPCLTFSKSVKNLTTGLQDANGSTAQPGDKLRYTLKVTNNGKSTAKQFQVLDSISDILDYSTVISYNGSKLNKKLEIYWPKADIKSKETLVRSFIVQVKNPLPDTPPPPNDPGHFDRVMSNWYGNGVEVKVPGSVPTTVQSTVTTLPNTGPGTGLVVIVSISVVAGYFLMRNHQLAKEVAIVKDDYSVSGGI